MKIIQELNQNERDVLKARHKDVVAPEGHIDMVIDMAHCFEIELTAADFSKIIIFAGDRNLYLSEVIRHISINSSILRQPFWEWGLCGHKIENHINAIKSYPGKLQEYFHQLSGCFMIDRGDGRRVYDVTDGQHRLVAYGLATNMDKSNFPIKVYWGTNNDDIKS